MPIWLRPATAERRFGFKLADSCASASGSGYRSGAGSRVQGPVAACRQERRPLALIVGDTELQAGRSASSPCGRRPQQLVTVEECVDLLRQTRTSA